MLVNVIVLFMKFGHGKSQEQQVAELTTPGEGQLVMWGAAEVTCKTPSQSALNEFVTRLGKLV